MIDAEYSKNLSMDQRRIEDVLKTIAKDTHRFRRFSCGNRETLQKTHSPEDLVAKLKKFNAEH